MDVIKLVVTDLDGTLLRDDGLPSDYTCQTLAQVRQAGVRVCFASGRYEGMMTLFADLVGGIDYTISCNGAVLRRESDRELLLCQPLPEAGVVNVLDYLRARSQAFMMYAANHVYCPVGFPKLVQRLEKYKGLCQAQSFPRPMAVTMLDMAAPLPPLPAIVKLVGYDLFAGEAEAFCSYAQSLPQLCTEPTGYGQQGVFHQSVSKEQAVRTIMVALSLAPEQVAVFGDFDNDMSMFRCAGHRVAMENATPALKAQATAIAPSNQEDGVARWLAAAGVLKR